MLPFACVSKRCFLPVPLRGARRCDWSFGPASALIRIENCCATMNVFFPTYQPLMQSGRRPASWVIARDAGESVPELAIC